MEPLIQISTKFSITSVHSIVPASEVVAQGIIVGEKVFSDLRNQLKVLQEERKRLIQYIERKGQFTGLLSFE